MDKEEQRKVIAKRADELVAQYGVERPGREQALLILMDEFGISDNSAIQYLAAARRRAQ